MQLVRGAYEAVPETDLITTGMELAPLEQTVLATSLEAGGAVGAAGGFEIPVWGWIATGVAVAGGVGYGLYKHYQHKHEADGAAHEQGFQDAAQALDAAKAGFKNSAELHFVDEAIRKAGMGNSLSDYAKKHGHDRLEDFVKTANHGQHITGTDYARSWGYKTPAERAAEQGLHVPPSAPMHSSPQRTGTRESVDVVEHQDAHAVKAFDASTLPTKQPAAAQEITLPPPPEISAVPVETAGGIAAMPQGVLDLPPPPAPLPQAGNRPDYRSALGVNLANRGEGNLADDSTDWLAKRDTKQWSDHNGNDMAVVREGKIKDTSVVSSEGWIRTTHSEHGKMMWAVVKDRDGNIVSHMERDAKGKLVEQVKSDGTAVARNNKTPHL
jgi:hypothetical protein